MGGGFRGGFNKGFNNFRFNNFRFNTFGFGRFNNFGFGFAGGWPWWGGWGLGWGGGGWWDPGWGGGYGGYCDSYICDGYGGGGYAAPAYSGGPNVTVIAPQAQAQPYPVFVERANPVIREYDQYGQERGSAPQSTTPQSTTPQALNGAPIYLIAMKDHVIRAAAAYWVDGQVLHYVTLQHEEKQAPLDTVDRGLSMQLNRERHVQFTLP
jgi:hypothetical protein